MNGVKTESVYYIEDALEEIIAGKPYAGHEKEREFEQNLKESRKEISTIFGEHMKLLNNTTYAVNESIVNQIGRTYTRINPVLDYLSAEKEDFRETVDGIHEEFQLILSGMVNIAPLLQAEQMMRDLFRIARNFNFRDEFQVRVIRTLLSVNCSIEDILNEYLPVDYVLAGYFDEEVKKPLFASAPYTEVKAVTGPAEWDLSEVIAMAEENNLGDDFIEKVRQVKEFILSV